VYNVCTVHVIRVLILSYRGLPASYGAVYNVCIVHVIRVLILSYTGLPASYGVVCVVHVIEFSYNVIGGC